MRKGRVRNTDHDKMVQECVRRHKAHDISLPREMHDWPETQVQAVLQEAEHAARCVSDSNADESGVSVSAAPRIASIRSVIG